MIIKTFIRLKNVLTSHRKLVQKINELEKKYDAQFQEVFEAIRQLMQDEEKPKGKIGFHV